MSAFRIKLSEQKSDLCPDRESLMNQIVEMAGFFQEEARYFYPGNIMRCL